MSVFQSINEGQESADEGGEEEDGEADIIEDGQPVLYAADGADEAPDPEDHIGNGEDIHNEGDEEHEEKALYGDHHQRKDGHDELDEQMDATGNTTKAEKRDK